MRSRSLLPLLTFAVLSAACTPTDASDPSATGPPAADRSGAPESIATFDLATDDLAATLELPVVALASAEDTARVTIRDLQPRDEPRVLWIHWRRTGDGVFRVTREDGDGARYLTDGPVAGISQTVVPPGATELQLLVVSETAWDATVVDGTFDALPTLGPVSAISGAGPAFVAADPDQAVRASLDAAITDQAPRLVAFDAAGAPLGEPVTLPSQLGTTVDLPTGSELLLVDVRGPWTLTREGSG